GDDAGAAAAERPGGGVGAAVLELGAGGEHALAGGGGDGAGAAVDEGGGRHRDARARRDGGARGARGRGGLHGGASVLESIRSNRFDIPHPEHRMSATASPTAVRRAMFGVFLTFGVNGVAVGAWISRIPAIRDILRIDTAQVGLLLFAMSAGSILGLLAAAQIVHRLGARRSIVACLLLGVVALL